MFSYYVSAVFCMLFFLYAFFPVTNNNTIRALDPPESLHDIKFNISDMYAEAVDRIVLIVIDALRYDFVTASSMPFITETAQNHGCEALVKVESPTVTMPRIKSLTTGSVPQFSDLLLNLMFTEAFKDSIIHRAVNKGKKIVFYGDDTWLKLYPNSFTRSEGTSSFYVNDYTEVDDNVTKNVREELQNNDWDVMILHYLGLDHIGHTSGPYSELIRPKLKEMDDVVKMIYESIMQLERKSLIFVTGDHGMKDSGGHGGTTYSETRVPFVLLGVPCKADSFSQIDIPVTLSVLMGLTIPAESIGKVSINLLDTMYSPEKLLYVLRYNVLALQHISNNLCTTMEDISDLHYTFLKDGNFTLFGQIKKNYELCASKISNELLHNSTEQKDVVLIINCMAIVFCFCSITIIAITNAKQTMFKQVSEPAVIVIVVYLSYYTDKFSFVIISALYCLFAIFLSRSSLELAKCIMRTKLNVNSILIFGCVLHSVSLISSSFIEEEHQTWYFFMSTFLVCGAADSRNKSRSGNILLFIGLRFLRKLNQTGDKWASVPDIADWLLLKDNFIYFQVFYILSLTSVWLCCKKFLTTGSNIRMYLIYMIFFSIYFLKIFHVRDYRLGQLIWCFISLNAIINWKLLNTTQNVTLNWILVSCLLLRPHNVILLSYCFYASSVFRAQMKSSRSLIIMHLWLGNVLFYCQGHSNSLASVDIAAGYIGLESYKPIIVSILVLCHTYSLPVLAHLLLLQNVTAVNIWKTVLPHRLLVTSIIFIVVYAQRQHLFVWSVFAPKLLIESSHAVVLLIIIVIHAIMKVIYVTFTSLSNNRLL